MPAPPVMKEPKVILVPTDLSETSRAAIAPAVMFAKAFRAKVLLVFVGEPAAAILGFPGIDVVALEKHQWNQAAHDLKPTFRTFMTSHAGIIPPPG